ncbi:MAG: hypothetical protein O9266_02285 [Porphyrobacter sp.]|jgi:hypothetical protein|nr:hypothetical protein [Porphyrobacter sp.]
MIPFLPELSATPLSAAPLPKTLAGGTGAGASEAEGGGRPALDFAGLLDAVLPGGAQALPGAVAADSGAPAAPAPDLVPVMRPLGSLVTGTKAGDDVLPAILPPSGTSLPDSGSDLPPAGAPPLPAQPQSPVAVLAVPPAPAPLAAESAGTGEGASEQPEAASPEAALLALLPAVLPAPVFAATPAAAAIPTPARAGGAAPAPAIPAAALAPAAPAVPAAGLPALPVSPAEEEAPAGLALASSAPEAAPQPATGTAPAPVPQASAPALAQSMPPAAPAPVTERAEARVPAPQQETAIAQLGEIREALRSVRPEMTLRHAEFGFVSLRIEAAATAPQDWRAVLASRDPGFVPAIQAALAERAVAASADSAATGGQTGGHTGSGTGSDRNYGFSQGSGQGSSQPYLGHSGGREEGAGSNPRNQQQARAGDDAATAAGAPESEAPGQRQRGLFA